MSPIADNPLHSITDLYVLQVVLSSVLLFSQSASKQVILTNGQSCKLWNVEPQQSASREKDCSTATHNGS